MIGFRWLFMNDDVKICLVAICVGHDLRIDGSGLGLGLGLRAMG